MANVFQETHLPRAEQEGYQYLATLPEVKKFLDAEIFEKIVHTRTQIIEGILALVEFDVIAPKLMPHPRARMLEHGLVTRNNCLHGNSIPGGINQTLGFFGSSLQVSLNFRSQAANSEEESARRQILAYIEDGKFDYAARIKEKVSNDFLQSDEVKRAIQLKLIENLSFGLFHLVTDLLEHFEIPEGQIQEAAEKAFMEALTYGNIYEADGILSRFHLSDEFVQSEEVKKIVKKAKSETVFSAHTLSPQLQQLLRGSTYLNE